MKTDAVLTEVWKVKDKLGAKHDYNVDVLFSELQAHQKVSRRKYVRLRPRKSKTQ